MSIKSLVFGSMEVDLIHLPYKGELGSYPDLDKIAEVAKMAGKVLVAYMPNKNYMIGDDPSVKCFMLDWNKLPTKVIIKDHEALDEGSPALCCAGEYLLEYPDGIYFYMPTIEEKYERSGTTGIYWLKKEPDPI